MDFDSVARRPKAATLLYRIELDSDEVNPLSWGSIETVQAGVRACSWVCGVPGSVIVGYYNNTRHIRRARRSSCRSYVHSASIQASKPCRLRCGRGFDTYIQHGSTVALHLAVSAEEPDADIWCSCSCSLAPTHHPRQQGPDAPRQGASTMRVTWERVGRKKPKGNSITCFTRSVRSFFLFRACSLYGRHRVALWSQIRLLLVLKAAASITRSLFIF